MTRSGSPARARSSSGSTASAASSSRALARRGRSPLGAPSAML
eukprot:CAMPEP_0180009340 /NCGR_PEP_ID=MMETSP0984-20121128/15035_1 /TAXON_ID=483367 /ORGANISM="non described non described, Strain CCMP 2436" /LENGTH=42 /DNA_ID= /DNA_START= /DNA_END= /DNA_ORIENTATION=